MTDEIDRRSHRALDKALIEIDIYLQTWGRWARGEISRHAWPRESPMFKTIREIRLGINARSTATGLEASREVIAVDRAVAQLTEQQRAAVWAHYIAQGETRYHCARHARMSEREFVRQLERARWCVYSVFPVFMAITEGGIPTLRSDNRESGRLGDR